MKNTNNDYSDSQIKNQILMERQQRRQRKRCIRRVIMCALVILAVADGVLTGRIIGRGSAVIPEVYGEATEIYAPPEFVPTAADQPLVAIAMDEVGSDNNGGSKFWSWYGYDGQVSWCGCFVSWCEARAGYLSDGRAPKFSYVPDGADWFKGRGQWLDAGETPAPGDIIFFDWEQDGGRDHVGIVTAVIGDRVFAVEGNSSNRCRQKRYMLDDPVIYGYGHITSD